MRASTRRVEALLEKLIIFLAGGSYSRSLQPMVVQQLLNRSIPDPVLLDPELDDSRSDVAETVHRVEREGVESTVIGIVRAPIV